MKSKSSHRKKSIDTADRNNLSKIKLGLILALIGSYFVFSDTLGASVFIDNLKSDFTQNSFHIVRFPFLKLNGKMAISVFLYCIALLLFCWEIFNLKVKK